MSGDVPDGHALVDAHGRYLHVNPAGCAMLGLPVAELLGRPAVFVTGQSARAESTRAQSPRPALDPLSSGTRTLRWRYRGGSGDERELEYRVVPVTGAGSAAAAICFRDVTDTRVAERRSIAAVAHGTPPGFVTGSRGRSAPEKRHRLARALHDSACQQLFSLALHVRAVQLSLRPRGVDDQALQNALRTIGHLAHAALDDLRGLVFELHPQTLHEEGLVAAVRRLTGSIAARTGLRIALEAQAEGLDLDVDTELEVYRLVQEALHNSVEHGGATCVRIDIGQDAQDPGALVVEVVDDGRGFAPEGSTGHGLTSLREGAQRLGGALDLRTAPGMGTIVRARLPRAPRPQSRSGTR